MKTNTIIGTVIIVVALALGWFTMFKEGFAFINNGMVRTIVMTLANLIEIAMLVVGCYLIMDKKGGK